MKLVFYSSREVNSVTTLWLNKAPLSQARGALWSFGARLKGVPLRQVKGVPQSWGCPSVQKSPVRVQRSTLQLMLRECFRAKEDLAHVSLDLTEYSAARAEFVSIVG